ncbi:MAG: type II toxin-antitoxin system RelE/ParE family toxin [bacterium]
MSPYRLTYSQACRSLIKKLNPKIKPALKNEIERLSTTLLLGKPLIEELDGIYSLPYRRYLIIYRVNNQEKVVEIHFVGHRKDIYEDFRKLLVGK